jgi:isoamyl acetate esterase
VLFGDSLTQFSFGEAAVTRFGWGSLLSRAYQRGADVLNRGFSGYNTRFAMDLVPKIFGAGETRPKYLFVTVFLGANDAAIAGERQHVPVEEYGENMAKIIKGIREETKESPDLPIIIMTPPPVDEKAWKRFLNLFDYCDRTNELSRQYGLEAKRVAEQMGCSVLDTWEILGGDQEGYRKFLSDGLHLNESGNELVFEGLMNLISVEHVALAPQQLIQGKYQGEGIPPEEKLWDQLC